jgi:DNA-binding GntR family transcriptional regulator
VNQVPPTAGTTRQYKYVHVVEFVQDRIRRGVHKPGDAVTTDPLVKELAVSLLTVRKALRVMAQDGVLKFWPAYGYCVTDEAVAILSKEGRKLGEYILLVDHAGANRILRVPDGCTTDEFRVEIEEKTATLATLNGLLAIKDQKTRT